MSMGSPAVAAVYDSADPPNIITAACAAVAADTPNKRILTLKIECT